MRLPSEAFINANITSAFTGIQSIATTGSILNISNALQSNGPVLVGGGGSSDQGAGGGGASGGGGSGSRSPGPGGGGGGTGGFAGGSGTVGGPSSRDTCRKITPAPPPDPDDGKDKAGPGPSPNSGFSGNGQGNGGVVVTGMYEFQINPCEGGPSPINKNRVKGKPQCFL